MLMESGSLKPHPYTESLKAEIARGASLDVLQNVDPSAPDLYEHGSIHAESIEEHYLNFSDADEKEFLAEAEAHKKAEQAHEEASKSDKPETDEKAAKLKAFEQAELDAEYERKDRQGQFSSGDIQRSIGKTATQTSRTTNARKRRKTWRDGRAEAAYSEDWKLR